MATHDENATSARKPDRVRLWDKDMNLIGEINPDENSSGGETSND